jgi:hypothetical protein
MGNVLVLLDSILLMGFVRIVHILLLMVNVDSVLWIIVCNVLILAFVLLVLIGNLLQLWMVNVHVGSVMRVSILRGIVQGVGRLVVKYAKQMPIPPLDVPNVLTLMQPSKMECVLVQMDKLCRMMVYATLVMPLAVRHVPRMILSSVRSVLGSQLLSPTMMANVSVLVIPLI